ncbi:armadillo-type protein [Mycena amicta]|nr:armadillo-type protein [Mycena amicta]
MDLDRCIIPANPDVSGIGVRAAIYAQNLLCFAPVVAHLRDGHVSADEMKGVKDQSIGMLAIAFAILISTIIEATATNITGQGLTRFHAAVILDLSWMNNTSTWIWVLLYIHHLTKPDPNDSEKMVPVPATWSAWTDVLLAPLLWLVKGTEKYAASSRMPVRITVVRRSWHFLSQKAVLTLGSFHLSLMAAVGIWLWSDPSKFGSPIPCDPSLTVVGGAAPFSSSALRGFSLAVYSLLVIPGLNLVPPFIFFLALHISYNWSRHRHARFWSRLEWLIACARQIGTQHRRPYDDVESGKQLTRPSEHPACSEPGPAPAKNHTAFLIVGLICLVIINLILLVDIELTLIRNTRNQSREEDEWGFGQVLALILLVVPLRDFVTSILDIREKLEKAKENLQNMFNDDLRHALDADNLDDYVYRFKRLIEQGANPNVELDGKNLVWLSSMRPLPKNGVTRAPQIVTLLQFAAYKGKEDLIEYLLRRGVKDRAAFKAAVRHNHFMSAHLLGKARNETHRAETRHRAIQTVVQALRDPHPNVRQMALACLCDLGAQVEFQDKIQAAIPIVGEALKGSDSFARRAALVCLGGLGTQVAFQHEIRPLIPLVVEALQDADPHVRGAAFASFTSLGAQVEFQNESSEAISIVLKELADSSSGLRAAALACVASLGSQVAFQAEIRAVFPTIVKALEYYGPMIRWMAFQCLGALAAQVEFHTDIRPGIPIVLEALGDRPNLFNFTGMGLPAWRCLGSLGAQVEFLPDIRPRIPYIIAKVLDALDPDIRKHAIATLCVLAAQVEYQADIKAAIPLIVEALENERRCRVGFECLSALGAQLAFQAEIRPMIPVIIKALTRKRSVLYSPQAALACLGGLGAQGMSSRRPLSSTDTVCLVQFQAEIQAAIPTVVEGLKHPNPNFHQGTLECLAALSAQVEFQTVIRAAIPTIVEGMKHSDSNIRQATLVCIESLGVEVAFQAALRTAIPSVVEAMKDPDLSVRSAARTCVGAFGAQGMHYVTEIRPAIPILVEELIASSPHFNKATIACLGALGAQVEFQTEIRPAIPMLVEGLRDSDSSDTRDAILKCVSGFCAGDSEIVILTVLEWAMADDAERRTSAVSSLSGCSTQHRRNVIVILT